jgi:hypothetical protein
MAQLNEINAIRAAAQRMASLRVISQTCRRLPKRAKIACAEAAGTPAKSGRSAP